MKPRLTESVSHLAPEPVHHGLRIEIRSVDLWVLPHLRCWKAFTRPIWRWLGLSTEIRKSRKLRKRYFKLPS